MSEPRSGEIIREGGNVTIGAPVCRGICGPTPSQMLGELVRHLKGVLRTVEDLRTLLEKQEKGEA